jgi:archaellum component FlaC
MRKPMTFLSLFFCLSVFSATKNSVKEQYEIAETQTRLKLQSLLSQQNQPKRIKEIVGEFQAEYEKSIRTLNKLIDETPLTTWNAYQELTDGSKAYSTRLQKFLTSKTGQERLKGFIQGKALHSKKVVKEALQFDKATFNSFDQTYAIYKRVVQSANPQKTAEEIAKITRICAEQVNAESFSLSTKSERKRLVSLYKNLSNEAKSFSDQYLEKTLAIQQTALKYSTKIQEYYMKALNK